MRRVVKYNLQDILDDVKKIDALILMHNDLDDSKFMVSQYEEKKKKLIADMILQFVST